MAGRAHLERLEPPEPWRGNIDASLALIDQLEGRIDGVDAKLRASGADHPYLPPLLTVPGKQRGAEVARVEIARRLAVAIWHMLTRNESFAPRGAAFRLAA